MADGHELSRQLFEDLKLRYTQEPRIGCSLVAHRDLGFCGFCPGLTVQDEANAWQLLAMAERGVVLQPFERTKHD